MCRISSLFLLQRLAGSMSGDGHDFDNNETRAVIKFFFPPARQCAEEIHTILTEKLGEHAPSYAFCTICTKCNDYFAKHR